jgi:2-polyprenyl-6-methoxyphenol hydroxylase-like FAD-dependent oxidoreductase
VRVVVIGGGIGGLTTALSLHAVGITDVTVLEAVPDILPLGVGINLLPHATRELVELGLAEGLAERGVPTSDLTYVDRRGATIWSESRGLAAGYRWPQYSIHRGRFQLLLLEETLRRLGPDSVRTGCRVRGVATESGAALVSWSDGDGLVEESFDVAVAADGIKSVVREQWHPDQGLPQWNGQILWRATSRTMPFLTGTSMVMAGDREQKFVAYPIGPVAADGLQLVNWIAEKSVGTGEMAPQDWNRSVSREVFAPAFADWRFDWFDVPAVIDAADEVFEYPMVDRPPLESWVRGRVALLGDAAHPTYPIGSNGSSQAIIDARVLAFALATRTVDDALRFYEDERLPETRELQRVNRSMGPERVMQMARERAPEGFVDIHDVIDRAELEEIAAAYKRVAGFDPEVLNERASWTPTAPEPAR